jgi:AcrR family transcriptional regulator
MPAPDVQTMVQGAPESVVQELLDRPPVALRLLEAARSCALDRGISRVTMSDVARRADVSRTTLYRHYPDVETVLRDLMTLDFGRVFLGAYRGVGPQTTARQRLTGTVVEGCRALRADDLFRKIVDVDPEFLLPYVTARIGVSQRLVLTLLRGGVAAGQADGSIHGGDVDTLARFLLLQAQALTISLGIVTEGDGPTEGDVLDVARHAIDAQLRPSADA